MNRSACHLSLASILGLVVAGCGGSGGGGGGASSGSPSASGVSSYTPQQVQRAGGYSFVPTLQSASGTIVAATAAPVGTDVIVAVAPGGQIERADATGTIPEATLPFDISSFVPAGSELYATTSNEATPGAAQVWHRDSVSGQWLVSLAGSQNESVGATLGGSLYAFQGQDGSDGTVSVLGTSGWSDIARLQSCVPTAAIVYGNELFVGGRSNVAGGPALLLEGTTQFASLAVPLVPAAGQILSVSALGVANGALFVAVAVTDATSGATLNGALYFFSKTGLSSIFELSGDAVSCLLPADGTIYAGTRTGRLLWLDATGKWNDDTIPANQGVTALAADSSGVLQVAVSTGQGPELLAREVVAPAVAQSAPGASTPPPSPPVTTPPVTTPPTTTSPPANTSAIMVQSVSPSSGGQVGGNIVTIFGSDFKNVTAVTFGGVGLKNVIVTTTEIQGVTPPAAAAGNADVVVVSSTEGTSTLTAGFDYLAPTASAPSYATDVFPIISANCVVCHTPGGSASFAMLTPYASIMAGAGSGFRFVAPNDTADSWLIWKTDSTVGGVDATMVSHLTAAQEAVFQAWIAGGAKP
jgi:hypothetical protein